jgi:hypothetical protein
MRRYASFLIALLFPAAASAGPPFMTDDPEPTDTGHWEIYAPLYEASGRGDEFEGALGAEINFGAAKDIQLTVALPAAYIHDADGWHWGVGDLEASVKYRFYQDKIAGVQVAAFPAITLPTASRGLGADHVTALLPIWGQKDFGAWSVFGGGGYAINPGSGNRNYWTGGVALTRQFGERVLLGIEADRHGRDSSNGSASTSLGIGAIYDLPGPLRLLGSGGPTIDDSGAAGFHAFAAIGIDL